MCMQLSLTVSRRGINDREDCPSLHENPREYPIESFLHDFLHVVIRLRAFRLKRGILLFPQYVALIMLTLSPY